MAGALEEQVRLGALPVQELQIELRGIRGGQARIVAEGFFQLETGTLGVLRKEESHVFDTQGFNEALAGRGEHGIQVGFRPQFAGEFHQRPAVIVAVLIEMAVQPLLHPGADRLQQEGGHQHNADHRAHRQILERNIDHDRQREDDAVESGQHADGGQRVGVAAAEEDFHVHQPVAHHRIGQGQRDQHHGEHHQLQVLARQASETGIRQHVEDGAGEESADGAIAQPLQLLADEGIVGAAALNREDDGAQSIRGEGKDAVDAVEPPADFDQRPFRGMQGARGKSHVGAKQQRSRQV